MYGVIPGPREPSGVLNTYMELLVDELQALWKGVYVDFPRGTWLKKKWVRAALMNVACDTPAMRKVLGFTGHSAIKGCSKCLLPIGYRKYNKPATTLQLTTATHDPSFAVQECYTFL